MIDAATRGLIERQIRRDGRSLLQYTDEAFPYTPAASEPARAQVDALAREEQAAIAGLIRFTHRNHVTPPVLDSYPSHFTTINFVAIGYLLPGLLKEQQLAVAELERSILVLPESEGRHALADYLQMKRRHLQSLQELGGPG